MPREPIRSAADLLVTLCRREQPPETFEEAPMPERWFDELLEQALRHRVLGLCLHALDRSGLGARLFPAQLPALRARLRGLRRRAALVWMETDRVLDTLDRAGICAIPLKGAALAPLYYADPVERDMEDVDVLVAERDLRPALQALLGSGYTAPWTESAYRFLRRRHFHVPLRSPTGLLLEVHWALAPRRSPFRLEISLDGRARVRPTRWGRPWPGPPPERVVLHLVLQCVQERFARLSRLVDLDRILASEPDLDWLDIASTARAGNLGYALHAALRLCESLLGRELPSRVELAPLAPPRMTAFHLGLICSPSHLLAQRLSHRHAAARLLEFWLLPGGGARYRFLRALVRERPPVAGRNRSAPDWSVPLKLLPAQLLVYSWKCYHATKLGARSKRSEPPPGGHPQPRGQPGPSRRG